jgi:hypothetical protein
MKILLPLGLLLLSGCTSVDRLAGYELAPASNSPGMTVRPVTLQAANRASSCNGPVVDGVCYASISSEGSVGAATASARSATGE